MTIVAYASSILGLAAVALTVLLNYRKARDDSPTQKRLAALENQVKKNTSLIFPDFDTFKGAVDEKLGTDQRRLKRLEELQETDKEFQKLLLKSISVILEHLQSGNHTERIKEMESAIQVFLTEMVFKM
jgi:hypothetical protein